jgi:hypothetical protein
VNRARRRKAKARRALNRQVHTLMTAPTVDYFDAWREAFPERRIEPEDVQAWRDAYPATSKLLVLDVLFEAEEP